MSALTCYVDKPHKYNDRKKKNVVEEYIPNEIILKVQNPAKLIVCLGLLVCVAQVPGRAWDGVHLIQRVAHLWRKGETGSFNSVGDVLFLKPDGGTWVIIICYLLYVRNNRIHFK